MSAELITDQVKRAKARWLKRVMQHPVATSTQKCLAFTIADRLNCVTLDCWASQETLARDVGYKSSKTIQRAGNGLASLNLVSLKRLKVRRHAPVFYPEDFDKPVSKNGQPRPKTADTDVHQSFLDIHSKSSSTATDEASKSKPRSGSLLNPKEAWRDRNQACQHAWSRRTGRSYAARGHRRRHPRSPVSGLR